jgi:hypothetical protein
MEQKKDFKYWFENVFWYHYKWWALAAVFVIAMVVFITVESCGQEHYDMTVVFVQDGDISTDQAQSVLDAISGSVGDLDGNGEVKLNYVSINVGDSSENSSSSGTYGAQTVSNEDRILMYLTDSDNALFFVNEAVSESYCALGYFDDALSDYGISTQEGDPYRVYVSDSDAFENAGMSDYDYYALIIDWTTVGKGSQDRTDAAVNAIKSLVS